MTERRVAVVYIDGACDKANVGGWAWRSKGGHADFGAEPGTSNNRMELRAAIEALHAVPPELDVLLVTDSAYVSNCFLERWYDGWRANGWVNSKKRPVENRDLWEELIALVEMRPDRVRWLHVRGHGRRATDDPEHVAGNHRVDLMAVAARESLARAIADPTNPIPEHPMPPAGRQCSWIALRGSCWHCCERCNYNNHRCPGCGTVTDHLDRELVAGERIKHEGCLD